MGTSADKLKYLQDTKTAIKDAIVNAGIAIPEGTPFREYANFIKRLKAIRLSDYTIDELKIVAEDLSNNGIASEYYDEFHSYLKEDQRWTTPLADGTTLECRIIGINHDSLTTDFVNGKKAGLTFQATHSLNSAYRMWSSVDNTGGWAKTTLRSYMQSGNCWDRLTPELQNAITPVYKKSGIGDSSDEIQVTQDKLWLASYIEYAGSISSSFDGQGGALALANEGEQYEFWKMKNIDDTSTNNPLHDMNLTIDGKEPAGSSGDDRFWQRSCCPNSGTYFLAVSSMGMLTFRTNSDKYVSVVPCFCL